VFEHRARLHVWRFFFVFSMKLLCIENDVYDDATKPDSQLI